MKGKTCIVANLKNAISVIDCALDNLFIIDWEELKSEGKSSHS